MNTFFKYKGSLLTKRFPKYTLAKKALFLYVAYDNDKKRNSPQVK